jgi:hypothetical protein
MRRVNLTKEEIHNKESKRKTALAIKKVVSKEQQRMEKQDRSEEKSNKLSIASALGEVRK